MFKVTAGYRPTSDFSKDFYSDFFESLSGCLRANSKNKNFLCKSNIKLPAHVDFREQAKTGILYGNGNKVTQ
jgi:hypothetical protein